MMFGGVVIEFYFLERHRSCVGCHARTGPGFKGYRKARDGIPL
jgi:hypothetical protein